jgi:Rrf2 family protein
VLSRRTKLAIHSLLALTAANGRSLNTAEILSGCGGSRGYLEAVLSALVRGGLVASVRGRAGGFRLGRAPEEITFADVIRLFDGPLALAPCASRTDYRRCEDCVDETVCGIRPALIAAREQVAVVLEATTLARAHSAGWTA